MDGGGARLRRRRGAEPRVGGGPVDHPGHGQVPHRRHRAEGSPAPPRTPPSPSRSPRRRGHGPRRHPHHYTRPDPAGPRSHPPEATAGTSARRGRGPPPPRPTHPPRPLPDDDEASPPSEPSSSPAAVQPRPEPSCEAKFLTFLDDWGFDRPEVNTIIDGLEVDAAWRDARLIVELDGYATHGTRAAFERDRKRDRRLTAAGWRVIRLTWWQLATGEALARELRALLDLQPRRTSSASPWPPPPHMVATPSVAPVRRI